MTLQTSTLRPGFLVSLSTGVEGGVKYYKTVLDAEHVTPEGSERARWETEREIMDPAEHDRAVVARNKAGSIIRGVCTQSNFGLLCPEGKADQLDKAIIDARKVADDFNATSRISKVHVYCITGRIVPDDVEAVRAINSEVRGLLAAMQDGLANMDVKVVRAAASKAKQVGQMLSPDASARIQIAVDAARESAKKIVKAGEQAAVEVDRATIRRIAEQRTAFLDLDGASEIATPGTGAGRAIDLPAA